MLLSPLY